MQYRQLTTCIFILLNCCIAGVNAQTVNFVEKTGTQNQYEIERIQKITFSHGWNYSGKKGRNR